MKTGKAVLAAVAAGSACAACADTNETEVATLEPVVVYASRVDATKEWMPSAVQVFDADTVAGSGAGDFGEFLSRKAALDVRNLNGNPMQGAVYMGGFGENGFGRVKLLLDGEELNNVDMAAPNMMRVPIWSVERVEVIHGPSPVLYGDGAVAGVISATTDTRDYEKKTRLAVRGGSYGTAGANVSTKGGFEEEGLQYSGAYDYVRSDGYRDHSAYDIHAVNAVLRENFDNGSTAAIKANYQNGFYDMPGSLSLAQWKHSARNSFTPGDWARVWSYGVGLDVKALIAEDQWLKLDAGFENKFTRAHYESAYGNSTYEYTYYSYWLSPRYINEKSVFGLDNRLTVGFDFRYDDYNAETFSGGSHSKSDFACARGAFFVHDELWLTEELSLVAGARLERIENHWSGATSVRSPRTVDLIGDYELGVVYRPLDGMKTYLKWTRFHRSPFCDEMNYTRSGYMLKPETGMSLDAGLEWKFLEDFKFDFNAYGSMMEDEIFYNPHVTPSPYGWSGYNGNSPARTRRLGFDTGLAWCKDKVAEAAVKYSAVQAEFRGSRYDKCDIPLVPSHRVRAEVGVWVFDDLEVKGGYNYVSSQNLAGDFENDHDGLKAYSLFDVGIQYAPSWAKGLKASLTVNNLFDRKYCDFAGWSDWSGAYFYPAVGRNFMLALSYEF